MTFEYPLGLLGLIGIPILILIYIIKSHYTEQTISSTYIWELSEKFLKKRKPVSKLSGIISLILQILIVIVGSLAIAHPIITIPNSANEFCFVLDGSGSMNMIQNETTRLELAKDEIEKLINKSVDGSSYTLMYVGDTPRIVYEKEYDKEMAIELLNDISSSHTASNCVDTLPYAQEYFNNNNSIRTYLVTDKSFKTKNVEVINVSNNETNYAIVDSLCNIEGDKIIVSGNVISYEEDAKITVELYVNNEYHSEMICDAKKLTNTEYRFTYEGTDYDSLKIKIKEIDSLALDNEQIIYNVIKEHSYSTLLISDSPYYIQSVLKMVGDSNVTTITLEEYEKAYNASINSNGINETPTGVKKITGFGLYIFDSYNPKALPKDGAVWLFNTNASIENSGFTVQNEIVNEDGALLSYANKKSTAYKTLTNGIINNDIYVYKYVKYGLNKNFTTILECDNNPVVFAGTNGYGNRQVVFAFDLHASSMALEFDFIVLMKNFLNYSFPVILEEAAYVCGDSLAVNVISGCSSIRVDSPLGNVSYMDTTVDIADQILTEVGTYKVTVTIGEDTKIFYVYSSLDKEESNSTIELAYEIQGESANELSDGIFDKLIILFIILAVIYVADWMVYCYEQYQLR